MSRVSCQMTKAMSAAVIQRRSRRMKYSIQPAPFGRRPWSLEFVILFFAVLWGGWRRRGEQDHRPAVVPAVHELLGAHPHQVVLADEVVVENAGLMLVEINQIDHVSDGGPLAVMRIVAVVSHRRHASGLEGQLKNGRIVAFVL